MRWESARQKGSKSPALDRAGDLSGHSYPCGSHNRGTEMCKMNLKSEAELTSADVDKVMPSSLPSSGKIGSKTAADTHSGKYNKIAMGTEWDETNISKVDDSDGDETYVQTENKENEGNVILPSRGKEDQINIANGVTITQGEDFSKRQEKQRDVLDNESSNEDSEDEGAEHQQEVVEKPVLNINVPSDSVSDVENQLKNLAIAPSRDDKEELCERSPMGNERQRVRSNPPYPQVASQLRCNGGGIVAESLAPTVCLYSVSPSATLNFNINDFPEQNNNPSLQYAPEFPFGEESSFPELNNNFLLPSPPGSPCGEESFPDVEQEHLDMWLNIHSSDVDNNKSTKNTEFDGQLGHLEVRDDPGYFNSPNINPEQIELCPDAVWPLPLSSSLPYRQAESIASLSSPSSGSRYSSECSPSSSPVPSPVDSVTGKSDSDTENEFRKMESYLQKGYANLSDVQSTSAQSVNDTSLNKLAPSSVMCGHPCYPLASHLSMNFQPSESTIRLRPVEPVQPVITVHSVQPANPVISVQSVTSMPLAQPARCLQQAQLAISQQPAKPARGMQQAQLAVSLRQTQPAAPAISVQSGLQNIQLASSRNAQNVIIENSVPPVMYILPQHNIQQGPVIPEIEPASARERMFAKLDTRAKDCAVVKLAQLTDDQLSKGDEHGDTQLMILIVNEHSQKMEYIYVMVSRLKNIPGALIARNALNQSALRLACLFLHHMPFVARFIAEVMLETGQPVNEVYEAGNTLLHVLCAVGDSHVNVLAELLSMKGDNNAPCFDINRHNHREGTPLHTAVKTHSKKVKCSQTVAFLLSQGADVLAQERSSGLTALHMAIKESCDPLLVQLLLQAADKRNINLVNKKDYPGDTALHYIALRNDIARQQQVRVVQLLVMYGAASNRVGSQGRTPLALVSAERRQEMQRIFHRR